MAPTIEVARHSAYMTSIAPLLCIGRSTARPTLLVCTLETGAAKDVLVSPDSQQGITVPSLNITPDIGSFIQIHIEPIQKVKMSNLASGKRPSPPRLISINNQLIQRTVRQGRNWHRYRH